jgi:hypothetical protein
MPADQTSTTASLKCGDYVRIKADDPQRASLDACVMADQIHGHVELHFGRDRNHQSQRATNGCAVICSRIETWTVSRLDLGSIDTRHRINQ